MEPDEFLVDFPTLGDLADAWIRQHCRVPGGFARGKPFEEADWQFWCTANHYAVRPDALWIPEQPLLNQAFVYRRSQIIAPQKTGKGPWAAAIVAVEAVGPSVFAGWAESGEMYRCSDNGCPCGWSYAYLEGEPKGMRHPSPLIQLTATSEDQVDTNLFGPLRASITMGPLKHLLKVREGFVRIVNDGDDPETDRIDVVTASAMARLGNPISFAVQDESGLYTKSNKMRKVAETQRRGAAGMGGRTIETTNAYDPAEESVAQTTWESTSADVFKFWRQPPAGLSYKDKRERRKIHKYVYAGSWWVNLDSIEGEAAELLPTDPAQAERFFGNRPVAGSDAFLDDPNTWDAHKGDFTPPTSGRVTLGFDGSMYDDWTGIRARFWTGTTWQAFTPTFADGKPMIWNPVEHGGEIPRSEVNAAVDYLFATFDVIRMYCDPELWQSEIDAWAAKYGDKRVVVWATYRTAAMSAALERWKTDLLAGSFGHDGCPTTTVHVKNARKVRRGSHIAVNKPSEHQKIDLFVCDVLANEAAGDVTAAGLLAPKKKHYASVG